MAAPCQHPSEYDPEESVPPHVCRTLRASQRFPPARPGIGADLKVLLAGSRH
jgi:hypothetical protein